VTRVSSALVLLLIVVGTIWFLPPIATLLLAIVASVLAFSEYRSIARALGVSVSTGVGVSTVVLACLTMGRPVNSFDVVTVNGVSTDLPNVVDLLFLAALIVCGALAVAGARPGPSVLSDTAATLFAPIYIGLPLGALAALRSIAIAAGTDGAPLALDGRVVLLLLMFVIVVSDSAQYYAGRAFGKRKLSPTISPKKTVEGAIGGVVFGTLAMAIGGYYVFASPIWVLTLLGAAIVLLGIVGDLFESLLKRSAGIKDSSNLIPGHGGVLDRIDSWLFAAPVYYVFVRFVA
jgi:CDP-diglyceride synthetase